METEGRVGWENALKLILKQPNRGKLPVIGGRKEKRQR